MNITGNSLRVLKFLYKHKSDNNIVYGKVAMNLGIESAKEIENYCIPLLENNLIEKKETWIWITEKGKEFVKDLEESETKQIIIDNNKDGYTFTLLKFLYNIKEPILEREFPKILKDLAPDNIHQSLFDLDKFIDSHNNLYQLNFAGKIHYESLLEIKYPKPKVSKKRYNHFKRNHIKGEWEFEDVVEFETDFKVPNSCEDKYELIEERGSFIPQPSTVTHYYNAPIEVLNTGNIQGDLRQESLHDLAITNPTKEPTAPQINIIKRIWGWVMNNPMSVTIVGGTIAMVVGSIILKHYHIL